MSFGGKTTEVTATLITSYQGHTTLLITVGVDLGHPVKVMFVRCLCCKVAAFPPPLLTILFGKKSLWVAHA